MQTEQLHADFRLWLSSMPDDKIPGPVIQRSLKVAMEQPRGVKANLHQAFISGVISPGMFSDQDAGPDFRKLVYNLCLFNSVILERKKYGSLGWNISYEFTNSDLEVSRGAMTHTPICVVTNYNLSSGIFIIDFYLNALEKKSLCLNSDNKLTSSNVP